MEMVTLSSEFLSAQTRMVTFLSETTLQSPHRSELRLETGCYAGVGRDYYANRTHECVNVTPDNISAVGQKPNVLLQVHCCSLENISKLV